MAKTIACIIVRMSSTRLPLKALRTIYNDLTMLDFTIERLKTVKNISEIYICTSREQIDDILEDVAQKHGVKIYRGSSEEVIERFLSVGTKEKADHMIRITGDNPFTNVEYLGEQIDLHIKHGLDYTRIMNAPAGVTAEVMRFAALEKCNTLMDPKISEYLTLFMFDPKHFKCGVIYLPQDLSSYTLTVDNYSDFNRTRHILAKTNSGFMISLKEIIEIIKKYNIADSQSDLTGTVKLPYGKIISCEEFFADLNQRAEQSLKLTIKE